MLLFGTRFLPQPQDFPTYPSPHPTIPIVCLLNISLSNLSSSHRCLQATFSSRSFTQFEHSSNFSRLTYKLNSHDIDLYALHMLSVCGNTIYKIFFTTTYNYSLYSIALPIDILSNAQK